MPGEMNQLQMVGRTLRNVPIVRIHDLTCDHLRQKSGTASVIIREVCREYRNSDLRADNADIQGRLNAHFRILENEIEILKAELARRNSSFAVSPNHTPVSTGVTKECL